MIPTYPLRVQSRFRARMNGNFAANGPSEFSLESRSATSQHPMSGTRACWSIFPILLDQGCSGSMSVHGVDECPIMNRRTHRPEPLIPEVTGNPWLRWIFYTLAVTSAFTFSADTRLLWHFTVRV